MLSILTNCGVFFGASWQRSISGSIYISLRSLLHIHNETVNIYSHLLGSVLFIALPFLVCTSVYTQYSPAYLGDIVVLSLFFFGVAICFLLSAIFHIVNNHSEAISILGNQLDYLGIVILMWGSTIPTVFYGFYCDLKLQRCYWIVVTLLAALCTTATFLQHFRHPRLRPWRAAMYASLGLSALVFVVHGLVLYGWEVQRQRMGLGWMGLMAGLNLTGAVVYATRVPERWFPIKCDVFGSSHQVFHVMVILAGLAHMFGLLGAFQYVHSAENQCT
ncbi:mPR-like GPCR protein [Leptodontidium sp. 2 PMI_412]|nr:mPR-like GPCR protein [Leptodontidium sp. 2 PMI_412]